MIRVVMRHVEDAGQRLLGDFEPDQIEPLLAALGNTRILWDEESDDCVLLQRPTQLVLSNAPGAPRMLMEILVEDR